MLTGLAFQHFNVRFSQDCTKSLRFAASISEGVPPYAPLFIGCPSQISARRGFSPVVCPARHELEGRLCPRYALDLVGFSDQPHDRPFAAELMKYTDVVVEAHARGRQRLLCDWYITRRSPRHLMKLKGRTLRRQAGLGRSES